MIRYGSLQKLRGIWWADTDHARLCGWQELGQVVPSSSFPLVPFNRFASESRTSGLMRRIALFHPKPNLDSVPSICNFAILLAKHGYQVDVFTGRRPNYLVPDFGSLPIRVRFRATSVSKRSAQQAASPKSTVSEAVLRRASSLKRKGVAFCRLLRGALDAWHGRRYTWVVAVDPEGLEFAASWLRNAETKLVYYSLELLLSYETRGKKTRLKQLERSLSSQAQVIVIQDQDRARLLAEDNGIPLERFVCIPNGPLGTSRRAPSTYWHERFDLPDATRVALHTGSLERWTGLAEIVDSVRLWPKEWVFVIHSRYDANGTAHIREDLERLKHAAPAGRVFFSLDPVPRCEYDGLIDGADVGIAFYTAMTESQPMSENIRTIGLSSGKIAYYLRAGLPIVVNATTTLRNFVDETGCGAVASDAQELGTALSRIATEYTDFSRRARVAFDKHYEFEQKFARVLRRLESV